MNKIDKCNQENTNKFWERKAKLVCFNHKKIVIIHYRFVKQFNHLHTFFITILYKDNFLKKSSNLQELFKMKIYKFNAIHL